MWLFHYLGVCLGQKSQNQGVYTSGIICAFPFCSHLTCLFLSILQIQKKWALPNGGIISSRVIVSESGTNSKHVLQLNADDVNLFYL